MTPNVTSPSFELGTIDNVTLRTNTSEESPSLIEKEFFTPFNEPLVRAAFVLCYVVVFALCVFGNLVVLVVIMRTARMRTRTNFFLANLAVADLSVGVFCVLPTLSKFISQEWILGRVLCKLYYYVNHMSYTTSIILLTVISIERYIAILFPLQAQQWITIRRLKFSLVIIWLVSGVYNAPIFFIFDSQRFVANVTYCFVISGIVNISALHISNMVVWYVIPLALMSFMYARIAVVLWKRGAKVCLNTSRGTRGTNGHSSVSYVPSTMSTMNPSRLNNSGRVGRGDDQCKRVRTTKFVVRHSPSVLTNESRISFHSDDYPRVDVEFQRVDAEIQSEIGAETAPCVVERKQPTGEGRVCRKRHQPGDDVKRRSRFQIMKSVLLCRRNSLPMDGVSLDDVIVEDSSSQEWVAQKEQTLSAGGMTRGKAQAGHNTLTARKKVIRLLLSVVISFSICVLPYHVNVILVSYGIVFSEFYTPISYLILYLNSGLNPILYALLSENFRKSLKEMVCYRCR